MHSKPKIHSLLHGFYTYNSDNVIEFTAIVLLGVLLILDVLTTSLALKVGGYETNTLMEGIVGIPMVHLLIKWLFLVLMVMAARFSDRILKGTGIYIMCVVIGWYSLVIANNTLVFMKLLAGS